MVGAVSVLPKEEVMLISDAGTLVRIKADEISLVGRNTQGVTLINLQDTEKLVGLQRIAEINIEEVPGLNLEPDSDLDQDLDLDVEQDDNTVED